MNPGDKCQLFRGTDGKVYMRHIECDQHRDGVVTDPTTGKIADAKEREHV